MPPTRSVVISLVTLAFALGPLLASSQDATLTDEALRDRVISGQSVVDSTLRDVTVRDSDLYGAHVRASTVERSRLENAAVTNATLRDSTILRSSLWQVTVERSVVSQAWIEAARVTGGSVRDSAAKGVTFEGAALCNVLIVNENRIENGGCGGTTTPTTPTSPGTTNTSNATNTTQPTATTSVFAPDSRTLAVFEFNGDTRDASGNGRDLAPVGAAATFEPSRFGQAIAIGEQGPDLTWNPYASLLVHPFTVEMVVRADGVSGYHKLFGGDGQLDAGWYVYDEGFIDYPQGAKLGAERFVAGIPHYLALVSTSPTTMDVYIDGERIDSTPISFALPPPQAHFFRDDRGGGEQLLGAVDAMRISSGTRSTNEIGAVNARLAGLVL